MYFWVQFHRSKIQIQLTLFVWFRQWLGNRLVTSHYLNQWWQDFCRYMVSPGLNELTQCDESKCEVQVSTKYSRFCIMYQVPSTSTLLDPNRPTLSALPASILKVGHLGITCEQPISCAHDMVVFQHVEGSSGWLDLNWHHRLDMHFSNCAVRQIGRNSQLAMRRRATSSQR